MSDPIPGWYPDPEEPSRQRFWDGTQWTEARAYPVATGPDGVPVAVEPGTGEKSSRTLLIVLLVLLAILIAAAAWYFLLRGDSSATPTDPLPTSTAVPTAPTAPTTPTAVPTVPTAPPVTPSVPTAVPTAVPSP
jgi:hypothetical protein